MFPITVAYNDYTEKLAAKTAAGKEEPKDPQKDAFFAGFRARLEMDKVREAELDAMFAIIEQHNPNEDASSLVAEVIRLREENKRLWEVVARTSNAEAAAGIK